MSNEAVDALKSQLEKIKAQQAQNQELLKESPELKELINEELERLDKQYKAIELSIKQLEGGYTQQNASEDTEAINPKDAIVEIRAAAGGSEAGLFAADLYRMYIRFAESKGWKVHQLSMSEGGIGNIKEVSFEVLGKSSSPAYSLLKNESGVHRVQRVPATESSGRIHTSTVTVAVLPKVTPKQIDIKNEDLKIDTFRSSGPGGQSVNTTDSAVRITHIPTGVTVSVQDEKSQHKNKEKALNILAGRLYDLMQQQEKTKLDELRTDQIGTGQRSEKIRTYNYQQDRVTDHRINQSWHNLPSIMDGNIEEIVNSLQEKL